MTQDPSQWIAEVTISLKPSVLDPQGATVQRALVSMGYTGLEEARLGKVVCLVFNGRLAQGDVERQTKQMCDKLLANPVIEHYRIHVARAGEPAEAAGR